MFIYEILTIIIGLIIGSFLNVCIYRIPKGESIVYPPSHCTSCNTKLKAFDLIPVFSYFLNKGKCRYCGENISLQYPFIELLNGLIYLMLYYKFGLCFNLIKYLFLSSLLVVITFIDYKHQIIPDSILLFGFLTMLTFKLLYYSRIELLNSTLGLLIGGFIFLIIAIVSHGGMGGGDIKLIALLGFFFGWKYLLLLIFLSFIIGAFFSIILLLLKIKSRKDFIPFGPFISIAAIITIFFGDILISCYINYFFNHMG